MRLRALISSVLLAAMAVVAPGAGQALAAEPSCEEGNYCFWSKANYEGQKKARTLPANTCFRPVVDWPDGSSSRVGSVYNNRTERSQLEAFDNDSCSGAPYALLRHKQGAATVSDRAKSFRVAPRCDIGSVCLYENADFGGKAWQITPDRTNRCFGPGNGNWGHAFYNATTYTATFYRSVLCTFLPTQSIAAHQYGAFDQSVHLVKIN